MKTITIEFKYKGVNYTHSKTFEENGPIGYRVPEVFEEAKEKLHANLRRMTHKQFTITGLDFWVGYIPYLKA